MSIEATTLGSVGILRMQDRARRNVLTLATRHAMTSAVERFVADDEVRCVVLLGTETSFAAGADLRELVDLTAVDLMVSRMHVLWQALTECPKPIIAGVRGHALGGGCELALHADIIVAGDRAVFGQPELRVGVIPGGGGTQRLVRAVGKYKAMRMILTGEAITAAEADAAGLVSEVVPDTDVETRVMELAQAIAELPPLAVRQAKEVVVTGADAPLSTALILERKAFQLLFSSRDQKEGMRAFLEKRPPHFDGA